MDLSQKISNWLKEYLEMSQMKSFVVGVSGGIDSALTSYLCSQTGVKTILISIPINQKKTQIDRAEKHINFLKEKFTNVVHFDIDISDVFSIFSQKFKNPTDLSLANTKSRLRMVTLYQIASMENGLVVGTGNKVEDFGIGFFTKYGDGGVDVSPIADLNKSEVREMAKKLGIINEIIVAKPTDGLWDDDRSDEDQIGTTYEKLEYIMNEIENNGESNIRNIIPEEYTKTLEIYLNLNKKNKHKITPIPIFKK